MKKFSCLILFQLCALAVVNNLIKSVNGCSSDRCRVSVRSVWFGVSVSVVSNKVPVVIVLVENVV